jgi:hypothetical protein
MTWPGKIHNGARAGNFRKQAFRLFAHTNREHASTFSEGVAKNRDFFNYFSALCGKPSLPAPIFCDNLLRGTA